jgi:hypothetical protein
LPQARSSGVLRWPNAIEGFLAVITKRLANYALIGSIPVGSTKFQVLTHHFGPTLSNKIEPNLGWVGHAGLTGRVSFARFSAAGIISAGAVDDGAADDLRPSALPPGKTTAAGTIISRRPLSPSSPPSATTSAGRHYHGRP